MSLSADVFLPHSWEFSYLLAETGNRNKIDDPGMGLSIQGLKGKRRKLNENEYLVPVSLDSGLVS